VKSTLKAGVALIALAAGDANAAVPKFDAPTTAATETGVARRGLVANTNTKLIDAETVDPSHQRVLVSVTDACRMLSISKPTLYALMASGRLRSVKIGRARRIPVSGIVRLGRGTGPSPKGPPKSPPWPRERIRLRQKARPKITPKPVRSRRRPAMEKFAAKTA